MGVDVVSIGEMYTALAAGFDLENAYFHGNSKTDRDIRFAMEHGIGHFVCDNADELTAIDAEAQRQGKKQKLLLMVQHLVKFIHTKICIQLQMKVSSTIWIY